MFSRLFRLGRTFSRRLLSVGFEEADKFKCSNLKIILPACLTSAAAGLFLFYTPECQEAQLEPEKWMPPERTDLPSFSADDVAQHSSVETDGAIWVTFRGAVYDVSQFHAVHPGGKIILQAAGGPLEPHWNRFGFHKCPEIFEMLEELRLGNLNAEDIFEYEPTLHYGYLPELSPYLNVKSLHPLNAEPDGPTLRRHFYTPVQTFYKRNHHEIPEIDVNTYRLNVLTDCGQRQFTVDQLRNQFRPTSIVATVQCAGNRRSDFADEAPVRGLDWHQGAIGNARWTGVPLAELLRHVGVVRSSKGHVLFTGLDDDGLGNRYETSIPIEKALDDNADVLLAYEMNDQPLSKEHGFPLRVIVPGVVGARSVKWLSDIRLEQDETDSQWQLSDYKTTPTGAGWSDVDFATLQPIQDLPVTSAICEPSEGDVLPSGTQFVEVKGYAYSGGGRHIIRVEVSPDGGDTWHSAKLLEHLAQPLYRRWAWVFWICRVPVPSGSNVLQLTCKATDSSHNCQPESCKGIHNVRGLLNTSWHRVNVTADAEPRHQR